MSDKKKLDERALAEQEYAVTAFDYEKAPVGSRDWCLFWNGWQACLAPSEAPSLTVVRVRGVSGLDELTMAEESAAFEAWRAEQIDCLRRNGYAEAVDAFYRQGSIHWAGWQARSALSERNK